MDRKEIVFAKQGALATKDWDTYQAIIRICLGRRSGDRPKPAAVPRPERPAAR